MRIEIFSFTLHIGEPKHPTEMRAWTGTLAHKFEGAERSIVRRDFTSHKIVRWYGLSYKRSWFFGFARFGISTQERTPNLPSYVLGEERARWNDYDNWPCDTENDNE